MSDDAELHEQALAWLVTQWSGEMTAGERLALDGWRQASPAHEQAWLAVQRFDQRLRVLPADSAATVLRAAGRHGNRRGLLRGLTLLAAGGGAVYLARDSEAWQTLAADYTTATGERRELVLDDGTRLTMNTATAIDVRFDAVQRRIALHRGEIMVSTGKEAGVPYRPFIVQTVHGAARALGTRFAVRQGGADTQVEVYESAVAVSARRHPGTPLRVTAGQRTRFTSDDVEGASALAPGSGAWVDGMLEAEQMRLDDFLAELGRYRSGVIHCDAAVAAQRVSGMYPLRDTNVVLDALARALPVQVSYLTRYFVSVRPR